VIISLHYQIVASLGLFLDIIEQKDIIVLGRLACVIVNFCFQLATFVIEGKERILLTESICFIF
jgi:hypothetical protein